MGGAGRSLPGIRTSAYKGQRKPDQRRSLDGGQQRGGRRQGRQPARRGAGCRELPSPKRLLTVMVTLLMMREQEVRHMLRNTVTLEKINTVTGMGT
eukprot:4449843-Heterocapsa_arctica.AAC.1